MREIVRFAILLEFVGGAAILCAMADGYKPNIRKWQSVLMAIELLVISFLFFELF